MDLNVFSSGKNFLPKMESKLKWKIGHLGTVDELVHIDLLHFFFLFSFSFLWMLPLFFLFFFSFDLQGRLCTHLVLIFFFFFFYFLLFFFCFCFYLFICLDVIFFSRHDFYFLINLGDWFFFFFLVVYHFFGFNWASFFNKGTCVNLYKLTFFILLLFHF